MIIWVIYLFQEGDLVSRNSHGNDIIFKIEKIIDNVAYLSGIDIRLCADSSIDDLVLESKEKNKEDDRFYEKISYLKPSDRSDYFYIPGKILHIDGDNEYLHRCLNFYKKANVLAYGVFSSEKEISNNIRKYLEDIKPDIVVITGHDSKIRNNTDYFCSAVKECRNYQKDYDKLIIIAGACQSDYEKLIKSGANFASSPKRINIHALDPAIIALTFSLLDKNKDVNLLSVLEKTSNGKNGIGGVNTKGMMTIGYPR